MDKHTTMTTVQAKQHLYSLIHSGDIEHAQEFIRLISPHLKQDAQFWAFVGGFELRQGKLSMGQAYAELVGESFQQDNVVKLLSSETEKLSKQFFSQQYLREYMMRRVAHIAYPATIQLETSSICNASCEFCPKKHVVRGTKRMSAELFKKIIDELHYTIPQGQPLNFFMNGVNEPFLDKSIFERLQYINTMLPQATIGFYSNMNYLPKNFFEKISAIKNITFWNISLNAGNAEDYKQRTGLDFDRTIMNVRQFLAMNKQHKFFQGIPMISRIQSGTVLDKMFADQCKELFPDAIAGQDYVVAVKMHADWLGSALKEGTTPVPHSFPCMQWLNITINCDGKVPLCCQDANACYCIGDVNKQTLLEIYNSAPFKIMREEILLRRQHYPCNTCSLF